MADTPVIPTPSEQTPLVPTPAPAATPTPSGEVAPAAVEFDVDEQALADLRKAQETEAAGAAAATDPATPGAGTAADAAAALPGAAGAAAAAAGAAPAAPAAPAGDADVITIPKARLDAVLRSRDTTSQENAFLKGKLAAIEERAAAPAASAPAAPAAPAKTQAQRLDEIDAEKVKLAERFDNGEISLTECTRQQNALERQARELLVQPPPARAPQPQDDPLYLNDLTAQLEDAHPYSLLIDVQDGNKWAFLEAEARAGLLAQGVVLGADGRSTFMVRERMAQLTDRYGPFWTGVAPDQVVAKVAELRGVKPAAAPAAKPAAPAAPGGLSTQAKQRSDKLALAARHPPDPTAAGAAGGSGLADVSDAQIAQMSDEEITALPDSVRRRFIATG